MDAGARLGPYEVLGPLAAGGMGEIWRARDTRLGRDVAIKALPPAFAEDPDRLRRFELEARATAALNHPNILAIFDIGNHEGRPFIVEELLEGETLRELLRAGPLPVAKVLDLGVQIAQGLAAAHEKGILHRDLKPENLFLTTDGRLKILDFGLAKLSPPVASGPGSSLVQTQVNATGEGHVLGTLGYMAPEQVRGLACDNRADIFAFGCVLFELLSGSSPFRRDSVADSMSAILHEDPPPLLGSRPDIAPALQEVIGRCLEKRPADRFTSAHDLGLALRAISGSQNSAPTVVRSASKPRRWLWPALLGSCALIAVVAVLYGLRVRGTRVADSAAEGIRSIAVLPLVNLSGEEEQEYFADGMTEELITSLSRISSLRVISRTSVMQFKGTTKAIPEIAAALHVQGVVEGSVRRAGDRVKITAQLIDASTDAHLLAASFERDLRDVLALQSEVARAIAERVKAVLSPQEQARLASSRPVDPRAHEEYLKGRFYLNKMTPDGHEKGLAHLRKAVELDPSSPEAYAALAMGYSLVGHERTPEAFAQAREAAQKAEELGGEPLAETVLAFGILKLCKDWDYDGAREDLLRALELNPSLGEVQRWYSWYLFLIGQNEEALAQMKRACEVEPLTPLFAADRGWQYWWLGQPDKAIEEARKSLELDGTFNEGLHVLGCAYLDKGMFSEAIATHQKLAAIDPGWKWTLPRTLALAGRKDEARRLLDEYLKGTYRGWATWFLAEDYAALGEVDEAFKWLEAAYSRKHSFLPWIRQNTAFAPLRGDPRFGDLERRLNLPPG